MWQNVGANAGDTVSPIDDSWAGIRAPTGHSGANTFVIGKYFAVVTDAGGGGGARIDHRKADVENRRGHQQEG